jgi:[protein-PII] uridylyltransferase
MSESGHDPAGVALIALGGYGRYDLAPNSDLDLLVLYRGWDQRAITQLNRALTYPLWDSGRELGDRIREPADVVRNVARIDEACALLDARLLAGDRGLFLDMETAFSRRIERTRASFMADLVNASTQRHERYGDAGNLLEPNLRDSTGGLRDINTVEWASKILPGAEGLDGLVGAGFLSARDAAVLVDARRHLLRIRIALHLVTGRHQDQLYLAEQDEIARRLGYRATTARPEADALMQELFAHAREVGAIVTSFWGRVTHQPRRRGRRRGGTDSVGDGCVLTEGRLEVVAVTNVADDPAGWLRVFRRSLLSRAPVGRASINRLHEQLEGAPQVHWTSEAKDAFIELLAAGAFDVLEGIDASGLLRTLIPEWGPIYAFPQRDLYHRYSIDRHLFKTVAELAASRDLDDIDLRVAWSAAVDHEALFVAALLHDIGKAREGDHSVVGAPIAAQIATRMGLRSDQVGDVEMLVREHLLLAETATRRDLDDPKTIAAVVERVGDERRLAMLYLLTRADSLATGPEAWSSFRAALIRDLFGRAQASLAGTAAERVPTAAERFAGLLAEPLGPHEVRTVHQAGHVDEFVVVAHDRPGLFATIAGVLAVRGLDVHDAELSTRDDGIAVDVFRVAGTSADTGSDRWTRLGADISGALDGTFDLDAALAKRRAERRRRGTRRRETDARVVVDNEAASAHTVVEIHSSDRVGLLHTIASVLSHQGCDISRAKVATYGLRVVDVFYVRDLARRKIEEPAILGHLERELITALNAD